MTLSSTLDPSIVADPELQLSTDLLTRSLFPTAPDAVGSQTPLDSGDRVSPGQPLAITTLSASGTSTDPLTFGGESGGATSSTSLASLSPVQPQTQAALTPTSTTSIITVTTTADSGAGSLRDAIARAPAGATIRFASNLQGQTVTLSRQLEITRNLTIDGSGAPGLTLSGNRATRILNVGQTNVSLVLQNLNFTNASIRNDLGGAIHTTTDVRLTVQNCQFTNNVSRGGGAIFVRDRSTLNVINSRFEGNDGATHGDLEISGGAIGTLRKCIINIQNSQFINNRGINGGGLYTIFSRLTVENSTFSGNDSTPGGPLGNSSNAFVRGFGGGIYIDGASIPNDPRFFPDPANGDRQGDTILIRNSRIVGNRAAGQGGGMFLFGYPQDQVIVEDSLISNNQVIPDNTGGAIGGGIRVGPTRLTVRDSSIVNNAAVTQGGGLWYNGESPVSITNSTFSGNRAQGTNNSGRGGAIYSAQWNLATDIVNSTFANNSAGSQGGAIFQDNRPFTVTNSIFSNNTTGNPQGRQHTNVQLGSGGGNLQFPATNGELATAGIRIADPRLGPLQDNGGGLLTHALLSGSAAINSGVTTGAPTLDQRGIQRDSQVDVGAIEFVATPPTPLPGGQIRGTRGADRLTGGAGVDTLVGGLGADTLTGGGGGDRFLYTGSQRSDAFAGSRLNSMDQITDFRVAAGDRIQLDFDNNLATQERPSALFYVGNLTSPTTLAGAIAAAYADKNRRSSGNQSLGINEAVLVSWRNQLYLSVNDGSAGFDPNRDFVVNLMTAPVPTVGGVTVSRYFA